MMVNRKEVMGRGGIVPVHHHQYHHQHVSRMQHHDHHHNHHSSSGVGGPTLRPHSTPATLLWLEENYEMAQGVCVPRNTLYLHYVDFCSKHGMTPVNAASFGKIIRQQFPQLTTRRLGTRGQSRYHYYGIAIRENSPYYELIYSKKGLQASEDIRKDHIRQIPQQGNCSGGTMISTTSTPRTSTTLTTTSSGSSGSSSSAAAAAAATAATNAALLAARLPDFPNLRDLCLPPGGMSGGVPEERVATFIVMYRAHCQRLLDTIIRGSFQEVQTFLLHYWQGMPPHLIGVLGSNVVVNIVGVCDSILYRSVCSILMSSVIRGLPDNVIQMIRKFSFELDSWLRTSLEELPENLRAVKLDLARHFCHMLRRQSSLNGLFGAVRLALHDQQLNSVLLHDWQRQDLHALVKSALAVSFTHTNQQNDQPPSSKRKASSVNPETVEFLASLGAEFERLLVEQAPLEAFTEWVESIVDRCVLQQRSNSHRSGSNSRPPTSSLRQHIRRFLIVWMAFGGRLLRDLSTQTAPSFETFHLIRIMIDDYFLYLIELLHIDDRARELMRNITLDVPPEYVDTDYESYLAAMFSSFDVATAEIMTMGTEIHSSPIQQSTEQQYADDTNNHLESPGHQQVINSNSGEEYTILPPATVTNANPSATVNNTEENTFNTYDYNGVRLPSNGYKFSNGPSSANEGHQYASYTANNGLTYYQGAGPGFVELSGEYNASYNSSSSSGSTAYQHYIRRAEFAEHCPTANATVGGFYAGDQHQQQSPSVAANNTYGTPPTEGYYGTVYDVGSSSSSSTASVYGELNEHPKIKKSEAIAVQSTTNIIQETECVKVPADASSTTSASNFHISSETYIRS